MDDASIVAWARAMNLQPTVERIAILKVIAGVAPQAVCSEDVFRQMFLQGTQVSLSTVYRTLGVLESRGLLVREVSLNRKIQFRFKSSSTDIHEVRLVCRQSGHRTVLNDPELHEHLVAAIRRLECGLDSEAVDIEVPDRMLQSSKPP